MYHFSFLDATKAFDRLVHASLHLKLLERGVPLIFLNIIIASPSLKGLQKMLELTEHYCRHWVISLNPKKSKNMIFGKNHCLPNLLLDGKIIEWVEKWTYFGVTLRSHKHFDCCIEGKPCKAFYRSANAILRIERVSHAQIIRNSLRLSIVVRNGSHSCVKSWHSSWVACSLQFRLPPNLWL